MLEEKFRDQRTSGTEQGLNVTKCKTWLNEYFAIKERMAYCISPFIRSFFNKMYNSNQSCYSASEICEW